MASLNGEAKMPNSQNQSNYPAAKQPQEKKINKGRTEKVEKVQEKK